MGILDRIAGTLDELTGDADAAEIARAEELASGGALDEAEAALLAVTARAPRGAAGFRALGRVRVRRGTLDEAVGAFGRAVDLDGDDPEAWYALGDALARLGRLEPARDAFRRALALGLDAGLRARAYAALGRVHARAGQWTAAGRAERKALELGGDDRELALDHGRTLRALGEREAGEWLTRAARAEGADAHLYIEAAAATADDALAERLLREGVARAPADRPLRAALGARLVRADRAAEAIALVKACVAEAPDDPAARRAARETYAAAGRWREGLATAEAEARLGVPPPLEARVALALGAEDRAALAALIGDAAPDTAGDAAPDAAGELAVALAAFTARRAGEADLIRLGRLAPDAAARRFVARDGAPPAPPAGHLAGLLGWTHDLASRAAPLVGLAAAAGHAAEALDRPLLVAVMGEFNAGKSSFVNALAGAEIAPTGVTPTTATVNVLRYGERPAARVVRHDGGVRDLPAGDVAGVLARMGDAEAREVRLVEIFLPVEALRRVEIVDTPGLNSIRPEHERVARDFLVEADAIVWVFAIGQAAKASEKEALGFAHGAGKRVLGVLNKIDHADAAEIEAVTRHVSGSLDGLIEAVVPFSATRALAARRAGAADPAFAALSAALEERFFAHALALKRATALSALRRFVTAARDAAGAAAPPPSDATATRAALARLGRDLGAALDGERVALRARIDEGYRRAAHEVREFVRPRSWLFGEHRATAEDEAFLTELLEDAVTNAVERTRATLVRTLADAAPPPAETAAIGEAIATAVDRFAAYAHGVIEAGAVPDFFRHQLPRLRLDVAAIRDALARRAPDPEEALFAPLRRALDARFAAAATRLAAAETDAEMRLLLHAARVADPLAALADAVAALEASG
jgi:tetratricopeptide (TPR) repeat protein/GTP-binding protein EngB required for normal cell division